MNNKGQVLPIFVIIFPIIIIFASYLIDIGIMYTEKRKIINITNTAIDYYIDNIDNELAYENTLSILNINIKDATYDVDITSDYITINVKKKHNSIYNIININNEINITRKGIIKG